MSDHSDDAGVTIVEVNADPDLYDRGHLPGSVGWAWKTQLADQIRRDILSKGDIESLFSASGISSESTVVLYGDTNNWFAAWAFWQMKYYGHQDARLMNGGRVKWMAENRPTSTEASNPGAKSYRAAEANENIRAYRDYVLAAVGAGNISLVDVRAPAEYSGELLAPEALPQEGAQRGGHIPGAANIPWGQAVAEDGSFKSADDLAALYGGKGIDGSKETIAYCRIGERSSHTWFVLTQLLGYSNSRNYDGSWTEWGSIVNAPIEKP